MCCKYCNKRNQEKREAKPKYIPPPPLIAIGGSQDVKPSGWQSMIFGIALGLFLSVIGFVPVVVLAEFFGS